MSNLPDLLNNNFYKKPSEYDAELKNVIGNIGQQQLQSQEESNSDENSEERKASKRLSQNERLKEQKRKLEQELFETRKLLQKRDIEIQSKELEKKAFEFSAQESEEEKLKREMDDLIYYKKTYENDGDISKAAEAEKLILDYNNKINNLQYTKHNIARDHSITKQNLEHKIEQVRNTQYNNYSFDGDEEKTINPHLEDFKKRHPFLDPTLSNNPNYSPRLFRKANDIAMQLEDQYRLNGMGEQIGSKSFYNDLEISFKNDIQETFEPRQNNYENRNSMVAPVSNTRRTSFNSPMTSEDERMKRAFLNVLGHEKESEYDAVFRNVNNKNRF